MRIDRESFIRFAVAVALACYDLPADRAMTSEEAAQLVKWVIDMALGPDASNVQVEPMENYPASSKMPLIISIYELENFMIAEVAPGWKCSSSKNTDSAKENHTRKAMPFAFPRNCSDISSSGSIL